MTKSEQQFEIALSFPGEHREAVEKIADVLAKKLGGQEKVFYDNWMKGIIGRPNFHRVLLPSYENARLVVCFLCREYEQKEWCGLEWRVIFDMIKRREDDRIVLLSFGQGPFQDLLSIDHVWDIAGRDPAEVAAQIWNRYEDIRPPESTPELDALVDEFRQLVREDIEHRCGTIRILSMPDPVPVERLYTDVNILASRPSHLYTNLDQFKLNKSANPSDLLGSLGEQLGRVPGLEAFKKKRRLIIYGTPGAGKTTFLKRLATECLRGGFASDLVPVFISLKAFAETEGAPGLVDHLRTHWQGRHETERILQAGRALVLLDGLDEVREADFKRVRNQIESFTQRFRACTIGVTCRTAARENRIGLEHLSEVEMADFDKAQIQKFVHNWFKFHEEPAKEILFLAKLKANKVSLAAALGRPPSKAASRPLPAPPSPVSPTSTAISP